MKNNNLNNQKLAEQKYFMQSLKVGLDEYYKILGQGEREYLGIKTGFEILDAATSGLDGLIILAGKPGLGKTSLALQLSYGACKFGTPIIFYSLGMPKRAIITKIISRLAEISYSEILLKGGLYLELSVLNTKLNPDILRLIKAIEDLEKTADRFYLRSQEDPEPINFYNVLKEIEQVKETHKTDKVLVVIDHLNIFNVKEYKDTLDKENQLITGFKEICQKTGATILLISQKSKAGFTFTGLQAIKGSVDIVYLADIVMFLEDKKEDKEDEEIEINEAPEIEINLIITKNRYYPPKLIELRFIGPFSKWVEWWR